MNRRERVSKFLNGWGSNTSFGIINGLIFHDGELWGMVDADGDFAEFADKEAAREYYKEEIENIKNG